MHPKKNEKVVIIGAGVAGLACARLLQEAGVIVSVFDKGFNLGGRVATRLASRTDTSFYFDHGAQYFTAKSAHFNQQITIWLHEKVVAVWPGKIGSVNAKDPAKYVPEKNSHERYVGAPFMRSIAQNLAKDIDVQTKRRVVSLQRQTADKKWSLNFDDDQTLSGFDGAILALPPAQAGALLENCGDIANYDDYLLLQQKCKAVPMAPCWATFAAFDNQLPIPFDGLFVQDSSLSWICRDSSKPGRPAGERWVLHASPGWSETHLEDSAESVQKSLLQEFFKVTGQKTQETSFCKSHRWRYALPLETEKNDILISKDKTLIVCGDWCHGGRVEGAYLSGGEAATEMLSAL